MINLMILIFIIGYIFIALEHPLRINKAGTAIITGVVLWVLYAFAADVIIPKVNLDAFHEFLQEHPEFTSLTPTIQYFKYVVNVQLLESIGDTSEIVFFLLGAMAIVELIDVHGGFVLITNRITTKDKRRLLWIISIMSFFLSAVFDNLTTAIFMIILLSKFLSNYKERWMFACIIIIAANSGGAWSPIGDLTTIMLWSGENVTTNALVSYLLLPSLVSVLIPLLIVQRKLHGELQPVIHKPIPGYVVTNVFNRTQRKFILIIGLLGLLSVPIFKSVTHLPPFMGILLSFGVIWIITDLMYNRKKSNTKINFRMSNVLKRIDSPTLIFFLGILMAVAALQASGVLTSLSRFLDDKVHNVYLIDLYIGYLSAIIDNVPLVAATKDMYSVIQTSQLTTLSDPAYARYFIEDGIFWLFLAYTSGVGGSMLIIGSAAGIVAMGIEKISFLWYLKNYSFLAMLGYLAGAIVFMLEILLIHGKL